MTTGGGATAAVEARVEDKSDKFADDGAGEIGVDDEAEDADERRAVPFVAEYFDSANVRCCCCFFLSCLDASFSAALRALSASFCSELRDEKSDFHHDRFGAGGNCNDTEELEDGIGVEGMGEDGVDGAADGGGGGGDGAWMVSSNKGPSSCKSASSVNTGLGEVSSLRAFGGNGRRSQRF